MTSKKEIWKAHPEYAGIEVSTLGRVRTLDRLVSNGTGTRLVKGRVLKQSNTSHGYLQVNVKVDGKWITKRVHRLIAQTFIDNPENLPQINHRDCNRKNNHVDNLEFCTASYNSQYRGKFGISNTELKGRPLFAINLNTNEVSRFRSQGEASRELGVFQSNVYKVIKGKYKQTGGFWFVNDDDKADDAIKCKLHTLQS